VAAQGLTIKTSEKSFYADFRKGVKGLNYIDLMGGELKDDLDLWLSSEQSDVGIMTIMCPSIVCNVPHRWNPADSSTAEQIDAALVTHQATSMSFFD
jgi:hypothetical protein